MRMMKGCQIRSSGDDQTIRQMRQMATPKTIRIIFRPHTVIEIHKAKGVANAMKPHTDMIQ